MPNRDGVLKIEFDADTKQLERNLIASMENVGSATEKELTQKLESAFEAAGRNPKLRKQLTGVYQSLFDEMSSAAGDINKTTKAIQDFIDKIDFLRRLEARTQSNIFDNFNVGQIDKVLEYFDEIEKKKKELDVLAKNSEQYRIDIKAETTVKELDDITSSIKLTEKESKKFVELVSNKFKENKVDPKPLQDAIKQYAELLALFEKVNAKKVEPKSKESVIKQQQLAFIMEQIENFENNTVPVVKNVLGNFRQSIVETAPELQKTLTEILVHGVEYSITQYVKVAQQKLNAEITALRKDADRYALETAQSAYEKNERDFEKFTQKNGDVKKQGKDTKGAKNNSEAENINETTDALSKYIVSLEEAKQKALEFSRTRNAQSPTIDRNNIEDIKNMIAYTQRYIDLGGKLEEIGLDKTNERRFLGKSNFGEYTDEINQLKASISNIASNNEEISSTENSVTASVNNNTTATENNTNVVEEHIQTLQEYLRMLQEIEKQEGRMSNEHIATFDENGNIIDNAVGNERNSSLKLNRNARTVVHSHPFNSEWDNLRFDDKDFESIFEGIANTKLRESITYCGNELLKVDVSNIDKSNLEKLNYQLNMGIWSVMHKLGNVDIAELSKGKLVLKEKDLSKLGVDFQNEYTRLINGLTKRIIEDFGGSVERLRINQNGTTSNIGITLNDLETDELKSYHSSLTGQSFSLLEVLKGQYEDLYKNVEQLKTIFSDFGKPYDDKELASFIDSLNEAGMTTEDLINKMSQIREFASQGLNLYEVRDELLGLETPIEGNVYYGYEESETNATVEDLENLKSRINDVENQIEELQNKFSTLDNTDTIKNLTEDITTLREQIGLLRDELSLKGSDQGDWILEVENRVDSLTERLEEVSKVATDTSEKLSLSPKNQTDILSGSQGGTTAPLIEGQKEYQEELAKTKGKVKETAEFIAETFRGVREESAIGEESLNGDGTFRALDYATGRSYGKYVEKTKVSISNPLWIDANNQQWDNIQILGDGLDENSAKAIELANNLISVFNEIKDIVAISDDLDPLNMKTPFSVIGSIGAQIGRETDEEKIKKLQELREAYLAADDAYQEFSNDTSHPYGRYTTNSLIKQANAMGHNGLVIDNVFDKGANGIASETSTVVVNFMQEQCEYIEKIVDEYGEIITESLSHLNKSKTNQNPILSDESDNSEISKKAALIDYLRERIELLYHSTSEGIQNEDMKYSEMFDTTEVKNLIDLLSQLTENELVQLGIITKGDTEGFYLFQAGLEDVIERVKYAKQELKDIYANDNPDYDTADAIDVGMYSELEKVLDMANEVKRKYSSELTPVIQEFFDLVGNENHFIVKDGFNFDPYIQSIIEGGKTAHEVFQELGNDLGWFEEQHQIPVLSDSSSTPLSQQNGQVEEQIRLQDNLGREIDENNSKLLQGTKLLDEQKKIVTLYHFSNESFDKFDPNKAGTNGTAYGSSAYLSKEPTWKWNTMGDILSQWYANVEKVFTYGTDTFSDEEIEKLITQFGKDLDENTKNIVRAKLKDANDALIGLRKLSGDEGEMLQYLGYDAADKPSSKIFQVFDPSKIVKATDLELTGEQLKEFLSLYEKEGVPGVQAFIAEIQKSNQAVREQGNQIPLLTEDQSSPVAENHIEELAREEQQALETAQAEEKLAQARKEVNVEQDNNSSSTALATVESVNKEIETFKDVQTEATEAALAKEKFADANRDVATTAQITSNNISEEANSMNEIASINLDKTSEEFKNASDFARAYCADLGEIASITRNVGTYTNNKGDKTPRVSYRITDVNGNNRTVDPQGNLLGAKDTIEVTKAYNEYTKAIDNVAKVEQKIAKGKSTARDESDLVKYKDELAEKQRIVLLLEQQGLTIAERRNEIERIRIANQETLDNIISDNRRSSISDIFDKYDSDYNKAFKNQDKYPEEYSDKLTEIQNKLQELEKYKNLDIISEAEVTDANKLGDSIKELFDKLDDVDKLGNRAKASSLAAQMTQYASTLTKSGAIVKETKEEINLLVKRLQDIGVTSTEIQEIADRFGQLKIEITKAGKAGAGFIDIFKNKLKYGIAQQLAMYFSFNDFLRYGRQMISTITDIDTAITELRKVSNATENQISKSFKVATKDAKELGSTINEVINAQADWSRLGYNIDEAQKLARVSTLYVNVGDGVSMEDANQSLISTLKGFELQADEAITVVDKFNEVANNYAIDSAGIGQALQRSAAAFNAANTDLSQSIALVTTANTIAQDPEKVGNAFTTLSARIRGSKSELEDLGEEMDEYVESTSKLRAQVKATTGVDIMKDEKTYKDVYAILVEIGKVWKDLSDIDQAALLEALAGKRQSNIMAGLLNNAELLEKVYQTAENSAGSAIREQENYEKSIQYSMDRLKASSQEWATDLINSDVIKWFVDLANAIVNVSDALTPLGTLALGGSLFAGIKNVGNIKTFFTELSGLTRIVAEIPKVSNDINGLKSLISGLSEENLKLVFSLSNVDETTATLAMRQLELKESTIKNILAITSDVGAQEADAVAKGVNVKMTDRLNVAWKKLNMTLLKNPLTWVVAGVAAVGIAIAAYKEWGDTLENAKKKTEKLEKEYSELKSSLDEINSALETTQRRIDELNGKETLSLTEEEELKRLQAENEELERKARLQQELADTKQKETAEAVKHKYEKEFDVTREAIYTTESRKQYNDSIKNGNGRVYVYGSQLNSIDRIDDEEWLEQAQRKYKELYSKYLNDPKLFVDDKGNDTDEKKQMDELRQQLVEREQKLYDYIDEYGLDDEFSRGLKQQALAIDVILYPKKHEADLVDEFWNNLDDTVRLEIQHKIERGEDFDIEIPVDFEVDKEQTKKQIRSKFNKIEDTVVEEVKHSRSDMIEKINETSDAFNILDEIYADVQDKGVFDFTRLNKKKFKEAFEGLETEYEDFIETVSKNPADLKATQEAFNGLVTAYLNHKNVLGELTEENKELTIAMLKNMGVSNAKEVVDGELAAKEELAKYNAQDLTKMTYSEAEAFIFAKDKTEDLRTALAQYELSKMGVNGIKIDTGEEVQSLINLAEQAGATSEQLQQLILAKSAIDAYNYAITEGVNAQGAAGVEYRKHIDEMKSGYDEGLKLVESIKNWTFDKKTDINFNNKTKAEYDGGDKTKEQAKKSKETFDWIETKLSRIQRTITNLGKVVSSTWRAWSTRNNALVSELAQVNQEIAVQQQAYDAYIAKANSVGLSSEYKNLVMNGGLRIDEINDETLKEQIQKFKEFYEKALSASDAIEDLRSNLVELAKTKFTESMKQYDNALLMNIHKSNMLEGFISQAEEAGYAASEVYYKALIKGKNQDVDVLTQKYHSLESSFNAAMDSGKIQEFSDDWYDMLGQINDVEKALQDANTELIKMQKNLRQLDWDIFDTKMQGVSDLATEADFISGVLEYYDLVKENVSSGMYTDEGLAVQAMHMQNYNTYMEQSYGYASKLKELQDQIAADPNDKKLKEQYNNYLSAQRDAINNAISEKKAIKDLISQGYDKLLESLNEVIDKRKEALSYEDELSSYEKTIREQTKTISEYKKQLLAYSGDNSQESQATVQKLQLSLTDAEEQLQETEHERWRKDQEKLLDDLYNNTQKWINRRLDSIDLLIAETADAVNKSSETIAKTINDVSTAYGYKLSDTMTAIWNSSNEIKVGLYEDIKYGIDRFFERDENGEFTKGTFATDKSLIDIGEILTAQSKKFDDLPKSITSLLVSDYVFSNPLANVQTGIQSAISDINTNIDQNQKILNDLAQKNIESIGKLQESITGIKLDDFANRVLGALSDVTDAINNIDINVGNNGSSGGTTNAATNTTPTTVPSPTPQHYQQQHTNGNELEKLENKLNKAISELNKLKKESNIRELEDKIEEQQSLKYKAIKEYRFSDIPKYDNEISIYTNKINEIQDKILSKQGEIDGIYADLKKIRGYKVGSKNISKNQLAWTQEEGGELIFRKSDGALLTPLNTGDKVFTADMTNKLWEMLSSGNMNFGISEMKLPIIQSKGISSNSNISFQVDGITMYGVNDPEDFSNQLVNNLNNNIKVKKIIQDNTIGMALGKNSFTSQRR